MKKLRLISIVLAVLMIFSTFGFSSAEASENPATKCDKLAMALELASKGLKTGATYIPETVKAFEEATNEARLVFIDKYSTNKEVSAALKNLEDALYGLETVNLYKDGLWQAFRYIENLNPDDYTESITTEPMETETSDIMTEPTEPSQPIVTEPSEIITIPPVTETPSEPASSEPKETENTDETTLPPNFVFYTLGDTDLNDKVTIKDATLIQKHLAMITELENEALLAADANEDQNITIKDTTEIQKFLANFPANEKIGEFCVIVAE